MAGRQKKDSDKRLHNLRERAEAELKARRRSSLVLSPEESSRLMHELEVHQIELSLQNEELLRILSELEESHEHLRNLYDFAPVGYFTLDEDAVIVQANLTLASLLGIERASLSGKRFARFVARESQEAFHIFWQQLAADAAPEPFQLWLRRGDRTTLAVSLQTAISLTGDAARSWRCAVIDITPRKRAERRLLASEQRLQSYLDNAADGIYVLNAASGRIQEANRRASLMLGYSVGELLELRASDIETVWSVQSLRLLYKRAANEIVQVEGAHRRKDGSTLAVETRMTSLAPSQPEMILAIVRDISERKRVEREREQESRRKDEFMALLGHELRNPLAAISSAVQLLHDEIKSEERALLHEIASRQVSLMRRVLDDLLDLGRIAHGHLELAKERVDLGEFAQEAAGTAQPVIAERRQQLVLRVPPGGVAFMADRARLDQIAGNLLSNASKYTQRGGTIRFSAAKERSDIVLRCHDNGRGIPAEMLKTIFEPFTRGAATVDDYGQASLGIGLALVRQLAELHGGTVSVESAGVDRGSEFTVRLPFVAPSASQPAAVRAAPHERRSIVMVEDNPDVLSTMKIGLERAGHRVSAFNDSASALSGMRALTPDAIILDIGSPGMDGYELLATLKKQARLPNTLFIGISGFKRRLRDAESGPDFDYYLVKPVDIADILMLLARHPAAVATEQPLRVLLVEDHAEVAALTAAMLSKQGLVIQTAHTARQALDAAPGLKPQIILCDMNLPDMDGQHLIRELRSMSAGRDAYAAILTARTQTELREFNLHAKENRIDEFLSKPLRADVIRRIVGRLKAAVPSSAGAKA